MRILRRRTVAVAFLAAALMFVLLPLALAAVETGDASEIAEGKELVESGVSCDALSDEQLEAIGEFIMEQMHPGESHKLIHQRMGIEEGTIAHEQLHINIARMMYCGAGTFGSNSSNMMGQGGMGYGMMRWTAPVVSVGNDAQTGFKGGMMGGYGSMMGYSYGSLPSFLYLALLIGLVALVYVWLLKLLLSFKRRKW